MEVRNIFFDMDEVLADFSRGVREIVGIEPPPQDGKHKSEEDKAIRNLLKMSERILRTLAKAE